jgi:hypothetical protein
MATNLNPAKVKLSALLRPEFQVSLLALMNNDALAVETSYALLLAVSAIEEHQRHHEALRQRLLERYGKKGEDGRILTNEDRTEFLLEDRAGFDKDYEALLALEVEVKQLPLTSVKDAKLSAIKLGPLLNTLLNPSL